MAAGQPVKWKVFQFGCSQFAIFLAGFPELPRSFFPALCSAFYRRCDISQQNFRAVQIRSNSWHASCATCPNALSGWFVCRSFGERKKDILPSVCLPCFCFMNFLSMFIKSKLNFSLPCQPNKSCTLKRLAGGSGEGVSDVNLACALALFLPTKGFCACCSVPNTEIHTGGNICSASLKLTHTHR